MGLFDFFKKKNTAASEPPAGSNNQEALFAAEVFRTIPRYISKPGAAVEALLLHPETNEPTTWAALYPEQYNAWKAVKSLADRRGIIYSLLDNQLGQTLQLWQIMERFNDDRYPQKALEMSTKFMDEEQEQNPDFHSAMAKTYFILMQYEDALRHCDKAMALDSTSIRSRRIYADVLHVTGKHAEAHALYNEILNGKIPKDKEMSLSVQDLLGFDGDFINSPVYAFAWLSNGQEIPDTIWDWANEEFYYSPYFRSQYGYWLIRKQETLRGFTKLFCLVQEMPWCKEAARNCHSIIEQMGMKEQMKKERAWLEEVMA
ncbi:lipopolysaccharide assembly protein LapB [Chitinophaga sp. Cy-1792]|uniref:tetratricopeptide repeat protein n=1 Tax=Chitinophaga sp. Cy-1792 TaxID=2608339 RepID=UPI00142328EF|nr:tetratricopeptide repeat protein [Chitinophaga sp. Cy-1792]NIG55703.1 tetratricopeptide repeat protein [Chitinophaga sp. Cy-1792]